LNKKPETSCPVIQRLIDGVHDLTGPNLAYEIVHGYALVKDQEHSQRIAEVTTTSAGRQATADREDKVIKVAAYRPWDTDNYETRSHNSVGDALEDIDSLLHEFRNPGDRLQGVAPP